MKLLLLLLTLILPMKAEESETECPGQNTVEMVMCASQRREEAQHALKDKLPPQTLENWKKATNDACTVAYAPYRQGTIYPQMVLGCGDRLNRLLLEELKGLGR